MFYSKEVREPCPYRHSWVGQAIVYFSGSCLRNWIGSPRACQRFRYERPVYGSTSEIYTETRPAVANCSVTLERLPRRDGRLAFSPYVKWRSIKRDKLKKRNIENVKELAAASDVIRPQHSILIYGCSIAFPFDPKKATKFRTFDPSSLIERHLIST